MTGTSGQRQELELMAGENQTISEYIVHHLTNLTFGKLPAGFERADGSVVGAGGEWVMAP